MKSGDMLQTSQRSVQVSYSTTDDKWTVLAIDLAALLAPVTTAAFEETKIIQFCSNMVVRGAFTADDSYTLQVRPHQVYSQPRWVGSPSYVCPKRTLLCSGRDAQASVEFLPGCHVLLRAMSDVGLCVCTVCHVANP